MATRKIETEIKIQSTPERAWEILTDFEKYGTWNPFIKSITGEQAVGKKLATEILPPNRKSMKFTPTVLAYAANEELRWLGHGPIKGLFDGEHYFIIKPSADGGITFEHGEIFKGILVGLMPKMLEDTRTGFELMNEAFKAECEK